MPQDAFDTDVLVIGGGNAGLCAAITAAEAGRSVTLLESAPVAMRGGNSRHTRNFRCMHSGPLGPLIDSYGVDEFLADLLAVTAGNTDEALARLLGVVVHYDARVSHVALDGQTVSRVEYDKNGTHHTLTPRTVVVASGGFQADTDWLTRAWGPAAANFLIRGTPYNRGVVLKDLLDQGIESVGDPTQCHAVAIDGRAPKFDGGIVTRLDCVPFSVVVNKHAQRFYDEGEDVWPKRYAIWGRLVAAQPDQIGYAIIDAKSLDLFMPSVFPPITADSLDALASQLDLPAETLADTVSAFNAACGDSSRFHSTELDGVCTTGLTPPKTNWARPIDTPPYYAYSLRPGVTFTYLGFKVDERARCCGRDGPITNLWAAGETMAGSILGQGYLAGFGMTIGTVFGRIAGAEAAQHAQ